MSDYYYHDELPLILNVDDILSDIYIYIYISLEDVVSIIMYSIIIDLIFVAILQIKKSYKHYISD